LENSLELKTVVKSDYRFLYKLLEERNPITNISHKKIPTYKQHVKFVKSKPYSKWYIIYLNHRKVGSIYFSKQDEIGMFFIKKIKKEGIGKNAMEILMKKNPRERYIANSNPKNTKLIKFLKKNGFKLVQYSYELTK